MWYRMSLSKHSYPASWGGLGILLSGLVLAGHSSREPSSCALVIMTDLCWGFLIADQLPHRHDVVGAAITKGALAGE